MYLPNKPKESTLNDVLVNYCGKLRVMMRWCGSSKHERHEDAPVDHEAIQRALQDTSATRLMYACTPQTAVRIITHVPACCHCLHSSLIKEDSISPPLLVSVRVKREGGRRRQSDESEDAVPRVATWGRLRYQCLKPVLTSFLSVSH